MSEIENKVIEATGFAPTKRFKDRQDYLAALAIATEQIEDAEFEELPDEVVEWINAAVRARKTRRNIPEFPDSELAEPAPEEMIDLSSVKEPPDGPELEESPGHIPYPEPKKRKVKAKLTGAFNRYGVAEGSKADASIKLFEAGVTMKQIKEATGETRYNLLKDLAKKGHKVEKSADGVWTLTHRDDVKE